jgi:hypothetical protein
MLKIISSKARECYRHTVEASLRARQTGQSTDLTGALSHRLNALRSLAMKIPRVVCPECGKKMRLASLEPHPGTNTRKETTTFICDCGERYSYTVAPQL